MSEMGLRRAVFGSGSRDASGDPARRVDALIDGYFDFVWRQLRRQGLTAADADDAAQEVFVIAARKIDAIEPERAKAFLYGTALRVARNARRSARRQSSALGGMKDPTGGVSVSPETAVEARRARALLDELLAQLPDDLRRVIVLAEVEELSAPAIAELEEIPVGTVASRLRRARQQFRELLAAATARNPFGGGS